MQFPDLQRPAVRRRGARRWAGPIVIALAAVLASCATGTSAGDATTGGTSDSRADGGTSDQIHVVASTNVWGDIAKTVGGGHVEVTALISDANQDPHEFEPSGRDELAVSRADVVIANGGGYDDFLTRMIDALGARPAVIIAADAADGVPSVNPDNEHLWFDLDAAAAVAQRIAESYAAIDPGHADDYRLAASTFDQSLQPVRKAIAAVRAAHAGTPVAITELLPLYLIEAAGLDNVTPASFSEAVEEGIDVSPAELSDVLALFTGRKVRLLVYNDQSASGQTEQVLAAAQRSHIPVLPVGETLPPGQHYQQWLSGVVGALAADLDEGAQS